MEAENYHAEQQPRVDHDWELSRTPDGYSGEGNMEATGTAVTADIEDTSPRLDYRINFVERGTHFIWLRMWKPDLRTLSVHLGLDGSWQTEGFFASRDSDYAWNQNRYRIDVGSTGEHTLNLWMGDDGVKVDKIVLTTDGRDRQEGTGPDESPSER